MQLSLPRAAVPRPVSQLPEARFDWSTLRLLVWLIAAGGLIAGSLQFRPDASTPPPLTTPEAAGALD